MASAMRASGERNPKATLVINRIFVFTDSIRPFESPCSIEARIDALCFTIRRCRSTNAWIRQRRAHPIHASRASTASS